MVKIVWTELSIDDLKEIHEYIADNSKRYAEITVNKIYSKTQIISSNPFTGRIVPEFNNKLIRELISGKYRIVYRLKNNHQADILRVYHTARLLKKSSLE